MHRESQVHTSRDKPSECGHEIAFDKITGIVSREIGNLILRFAAANTTSAEEGILEQNIPAAKN